MHAVLFTFFEVLYLLTWGMKENLRFSMSYWFWNRKIGKYSIIFVNNFHRYIWTLRWRIIFQRTDFFFYFFNKYLKKCKKFVLLVFALNYGNSRVILELTIALYRSSILSIWGSQFEHLAGICMFKFNNRSTRTRCEICSKWTIKTPEYDILPF